MNEKIEVRGGYESYSPSDTFESGNTPVINL